MECKRGKNMENNYINTIIETWEKFNNDKYEIFVYSIENLIEMMENDIDDMIIECMDDINNKNQLLENINYCKSINNNYHIVIDTPLNDDMVAIIQFDENYNIIGFGDFQTTINKIYCDKTDKIYILNDCFQFFRKIDTTGLLQHIDDNWRYNKRDNDIFYIPCDILSNILKTWINANNK